MAHFAALVILSAAISPAEPGAASLRIISDVTECPAPDEVRTALQLALGDGDQVLRGLTLWYHRDSQAGAADDAGSLLMELAAPTGELLISRRIPNVAAENCAAISAVMAAVVERSLRSLGWSRGVPLSETSGIEMSSKSSVYASPTALESATPNEMSPRLVFGAGPLFATSSRLGLNLLLDARVRVAGPLGVRLGVVALPGATSESHGTGRFSVSSRTFTLAVLAAFGLGRIEVAGGPVLLLATDHANSKDLPKAGSGTRVVVAVGAGCGAAVALSKRWRIGVELDGARVVFAPEAFVKLKGTKTPVLVPSSWQGIGSAKLEFLPWP